MNKQSQLSTNARTVFNKMSLLNGSKMEEALSGYKPSEIHCIEAINEIEGANVTKIAESLYMTRGAISKLTKKLLQKELIESYRKPENKKEIYFRLTNKGKSINDIHNSLHTEFSKRDKHVFDEITDSQFEDILLLLEKYNKHLDNEIEKSGLSIKS